MFEQLSGAVVLSLTVLSWGLAVTSLAYRRVVLNRAVAGGLVFLIGVAAIGVVTLVAGHLHLLVPRLPWLLLVVGMGLVAVARRAVGPLVGELRDGAVATWRGFPVLSVLVGLGLLLAFVAGIAEPQRTDEIEYHWPAPVAWAENGGWNASPYRHVNAFPFMEVVYTAAALLNSYVAAHWLHTFTLLGLGLCAAGIAHSVGSPSWVAPLGAATMVMPVTWIQAFAAYNDTAAAAFSVAALAVLLSGRFSRETVAMSAGLLVVAVSIKPTSIAAVGAIGVVAVLSALWRTYPLSTRRALASSLILGVVGLATLAFWSVRQHVYTGFWLDPAMTAEPSADALTMLPDADDWKVMPFIPLISGVLGTAEPWGGRTSVLIQLLLVPALVVAVWLRGAVLKRFLVFFVAAYMHWLVLGLAIVRTRFHIMSWALFLVAIVVVMDALLERFPRFQRSARWCWTALVAVALADVLRQTFQVIQTI